MQDLSEKYYNILKFQDKNQITSLHDYVYVHSMKLYEMGYIKEKIKPKNISDLNNSLKDYINNNDAKCIIILNLINNYLR